MNSEDTQQNLLAKGSEPSRVAVALQSSFLGFATHAGFLNALVDSGIQPDKISGSSSGSLVAAAYACGLQQQALRDMVLDQKLKNSFFEWQSLYRLPAVFTLYLGSGLVSGKNAIKYLQRNFPVSRIEDCQHAELTIAVTNISRMERQLISTGEIAPYVLASCAVSPVIRAQIIDGEYLIDGGFTDGAPFEQWIDDPEIDSIIIHNIAFDPQVTCPQSKYSNFLACWAAAHQIADQQMMDQRIKRAEAAGKELIIHETRTARPSIFSSRKTLEGNYQTAYDTFSAS
ncbi:MAG: patatin-like phospholipase family protein [Verrucomicrobiales bacterium]|nr:patatin-like phospholipase family protein [Verrucomicrobiales bacterium]